MKKKLSNIAFISAVFIVVVIIFSVCLSGCEKPLDEVYDSVEVVPGTKSGATSSDSTSYQIDSVKVDTVSVSDWESVSAGSVVFQ